VLTEPYISQRIVKEALNQAMADLFMCPCGSGPVKSASIYKWYSRNKDSASA
jgi:hypothetical protein